MKTKIFFAIIYIALFCNTLFAQKLLIPMDEAQTDHLRSYGLAYWILEKTQTDVEWLLNYRAGSFLAEDLPSVRERARSVGVTTEPMSEEKVQSIYAIIEEENMEKVMLEKAPKVAVYSPDYAEPWDDAVTLVLNYSLIPFETFYDKEVLEGDISKYDLESKSLN